MSELHYEVLVNDGLRRHREQTLPDGSPIISSPIASTLIYGERDAVLVDPPFTYEQVSRVGDWIERSGKHLIAVFATHGHGDHWFGTDLLLQRFPDAVAYATDGTIAMMHQQGTEGRAQVWDVDFPGQIPPSPVVINPFRSTGSSSKVTSCLPWRSATPTPTTPRCCTSLPSAWSSPVTSHTTACTNICSKALTVGSRPGWPRSTRSRRCSPVPSWQATRTRTCPTIRPSSTETREYLLNALRLLAEKLSPQEYFDEMIALYPDRLNVGPVWYTAVVAAVRANQRHRLFMTKSLAGSSTIICRSGSASEPARSCAGPISSSTTGVRRCTGPTALGHSGSWTRPPWWHSYSSCKADCTATVTRTPRCPTKG